MRTCAVALVVWGAVPAFATPVRLKELVDLQGARENDLLGYGLVVGLPNTGDSDRVLFTAQSLSGLLNRLGIRSNPNEVRPRNVAAVMVTAKLPVHAKNGQKLDVTVSSLGDARSLSGGTLLATALRAGDGEVYAVAQGELQTGSYAVAAAGSSLQRNPSTTGRVPDGARVERSLAVAAPEGAWMLTLRRPDFTNAERIATALRGEFGDGVARAVDAASVELSLNAEQRKGWVAVAARLEALEVEVDRRAKVVVSERTGTLVMGGNVRLRPAVVAHGGLRVSVAQTPAISQPNAFARQGNTVSVPVASVAAGEPPAQVVGVPETATVEQLTQALQALGATSRDLISVLQALKAADALDADLEVL